MKHHHHSINAIEHGDIEQVRQLLDSGADPNQQVVDDVYDEALVVTPLGKAFQVASSSAGSTEQILYSQALRIFDMLLDAGANPDWMIQVADEQPHDIIAMLNDAQNDIPARAFKNVLLNPVLRILAKHGIEIDFSDYMH